jgi:Icc-related predicted phosphoesterase
LRNFLPLAFFCTDLHGQINRYEELQSRILKERPAALFLGGDLLPRLFLSRAQFEPAEGDFVDEYLLPAFRNLRNRMGSNYPEVFLILGNDDPRSVEAAFMNGADEGLWHYTHEQKLVWGGFRIYGLAYIPPTPFLLKDWERYDVSRYVPPASISPEEGIRTVAVEENVRRWSTIQNDLAALVGDDSLDRAIFLFHAPPSDTPLDRAALDGQRYDHVPIDVHVGSVAIRRFVEQRQPLLTLHGHIHEAARISGKWKMQIGRTTCINGAHDGPELSLVRFDLESPEAATRELL